MSTVIWGEEGEKVLRRLGKPLIAAPGPPKGTHLPGHRAGLLGGDTGDEKWL